MEKLPIEMKRRPLIGALIGSDRYRGSTDSSEEYEALIKAAESHEKNAKGPMGSSPALTGGK